ncbi:TRAP transporter substrate-binding protein DctP [bacterium]|nr:TRAP transporter substrate-binding protein DctP [bacterium]
MLNRIFRLFLAALFLLPIFPFAGHSKPKYEIKFATLAPDGSTWTNVMRDLDKEVQEATNGEVGFRIYAGGVQGDEPDVIRKMRFGQLHSAGFTGTGLGEILPEVRVLELPFLFANKDEIDAVASAMYERFDSEFRKKGYVLLGWTEVGYVYLFSNTPIRGKKDVQGQKVWTWQGDPLAKELFEEMGINPLPLSVTEVLTGLQTGMLDAVYCAPYAAVGLQWFTRVKYMLDLPLTNAMGAVLMTKSQFDKIPPEHQAKLLEISREKLRELTILSRKDNEEAIRQMIKSGITVLEKPEVDELQNFRAIGEGVKRDLTGSLYSAELLVEVEEVLATFRENSPK